MNIWAEGLDMEKMRDINKPEDLSLVEKQEEPQDTTANGRRSLIASTAKGATQTDQSGEAARLRSGQWQ